MTGITEREGDGRFVPGHSLKSPGRGKGPSVSEQVRALIDPHKEEIIAKCIELAKLGDATSMKLCLERLAPIPRAEDEKVVVPGLKSALTMHDKATAIMEAVADGHISATAGEKLLRMLDTYGKAVILDEHERRLKAIEGKPSSEGPATLPEENHG